MNGAVLPLFCTHRARALRSKLPSAGTRGPLKIDFKPEFYFAKSLDHPILRGLSLGLEHRFNGKDEEASRSLGRILAEVEARVRRGAWRMHGTVRLYWLYDIDWQNNSNIRRYTDVIAIG